MSNVLGGCVIKHGIIKHVQRHGVWVELTDMTYSVMVPMFCFYDQNILPRLNQRVQCIIWRERLDCYGDLSVPPLPKDIEIRVWLRRATQLTKPRWRSDGL